MSYDVIVIGAGAAGEAASSLGAELGGKIAVVEKELVGGECTFWACMPSKSLLDSAHRRHVGGDYPWAKAATRRDWMTNRTDGSLPSDATHADGITSVGNSLYRGTARIIGKGKVEVSAAGQLPKTIEARSVIVATGSVPVIPDIEGLADSGFWTSREATTLTELPSSIVVLGGGPIGVEMAQVYARFGCRTTIVEGNDRLLPRDHPSSSKVVTEQLESEGVTVLTGVRAVSVERGGAGRRVKLSDGSVAEGAEVVVAVGRRPADLRSLGAAEAGAELDDRGSAKPDSSMLLADGLFAAGDVAGGLQFTHVADYQGRIAIASALGRTAKADLSAIPRATYTDPETAAVGLTEQEAAAAGHEAFEVTADFATSARGFTIEGSKGHVTAVVDRASKLLVGAFAACPGASELIHEAVLAIKLGVPVPTLADTIHAFPTGSRVFGNLMSEAAKKLKT